MKISEQILCSISDAAALLGVGRSKIYEMISMGLLPKRKIVGGRKMFLVSELKNWAAADCPNLENWQAIKGQNNGG